MLMYAINKLVCKRRARHTKSGHTYTDPQTKADMEYVAWAYKGPKYEKGVPLRLTVIAYRQIPKSRPKRFTSEPFTVKPDIDNIVKCVMDGLNGIAWADDSQAVEISAYKLDRERGGGEWVKFSVEPIGRTDDESD